MYNYYKNKPSNSISSNSGSFKYKKTIIGKTPEDNDSLTITKVVIPLKNLSNFWRALNIPLINCEVELILTWSKNCALADMTVNAAANQAIVAPSGATFKIKETKLYVSVVTLSKGNDIKLLEQLKSGFKRTIKWKKYRSQMTVQHQNNNLSYLIDPTFTNVNRLFVLSFQRTAGENNPTKDQRDSFSHYYVPNATIKYFNVLTDGKSFFELPVKNEEESYEKIIDMRNNNDYKTGNLLDFVYFKKNYNLFATDLNKQTKLKDQQQISFIGKILVARGATMFFHH